MPALLVAVGGVLAAIPGLPHVEFSPDLIFLLFVPPLLYAGAQSTSWREVRARQGPILSLGIGAVVFTTIGVALIAHAFIPDMAWPSAFALGAIVAPPDPVAAQAVLRPLGVSRSVETILEGEGLANDATSLILYRAAIVAALSGHFSLGGTALRILIAGTGGVAIGLGIAEVVLWLGRHFRWIPVVENTVSLLIPFAAYIPADRLGASGVLAVVAAGIRFAHNSPHVFTAAGRVQHESMWALIEFVMESLIFIFVGLELPVVIRGLNGYPLANVLRDVGIVTLVCIVTRFLWGFPSAWFTRRVERRKGRNVWPEVIFVAWAGVRGADSLVIALALPLAIQNRAIIIVITFGVIVATLVAQGFTLGPVVRLLKLGGAGDSQDDQEEARAWIAATNAALARLDVLARSLRNSPDATKALDLLRQTYMQKRTFWEKGGRGSRLGKELLQEHRIARQVLEEACGALFQERDHGHIDDAVARHVERYFDLQTMLLDYPDWDIDESPFEALAPPPADEDREG